jgi:hypothetical protein
VWVWGQPLPDKQIKRKEIKMSQYVFVKPTEVLGLLDRDDGRQRTLMSGIEALVYGHPHKKFYFKMEKYQYKELTNKEDYSPGSIRLEVYDYGMKVGHIGTYRPNGNERDKMQVEFQYNYNVHQKEPKNVKRSSDHRKILEFAKLFHAASIDGERMHAQMFHDVPDRIGDVTKLRDRLRGIKNMLDKIGYGKEADKLVYDLVNNQISVEADKYRGEFMAAWHQAEAGRQDFYRQTNRIAVLVPTPHNEYLLTRYEFNGREAKDRHDTEGYKAHSSVIADRESLPEDVSGKLAVLEISNFSDDDVKIDGVGIFEKDSNRIIVIGEDLNGIDSGTQSQDSGGESS